MKKSILKAFLILAICAAASSAYAANTVITASTSIGSLAFSPSSKVQLKATSTTVGYVVESLHGSGSRVFLTDSAASIIYWKDATIGTAPTNAFTSSQTAPTGAGVHGTPDPTSGSWTSM